MYREVCAVVLAVSGLAVGHNVYNLVYRQLYTALALFQQLQRLQNNTTSLAHQLANSAGIIKEH